MRSRWTPRAVLPFLALSLGSCSDTTGLEDLTAVLLDFCASDVPVSLAVNNFGSSTWTKVNPSADGTFSFQAAEQVGIAIVHLDGGDYTTEFVFATTAELQPLNGVACAEEAGPKVLNGTVADVIADEAAWISMARRTTDVVGPQTPFTLDNLPVGPLDLVAHREFFTTDGATPDRVIVRRAQNLVSGATITPTLDFGGGDSQDVPLHSLTVAGLTAGEDNYALLDFRTATGTIHPFFTASSFTAATQDYHGIPSGLTQSGDLHDLDVFAYAPDGNSYRGIRQFHRLPGNQTALLGAALTVPVISTAATSPHVRLRATLQAQAVYDDFVSVYYIQGNADLRVVVVTVTAAYLGAMPLQWDIAIPDMSNASVFPSAAGLQSGFSTTWYVDAFGGNVATFFGYPTDGASFQYAGRSSAVLTSEMARGSASRGGRPELRSPSMRRRALGGS
ncbi:MAG: hypothetical protein WD801_02390 [Gemmatimonadaceae bacterium]